MSKIQGYKIQGNVSSMDFNAGCNFIAAGGKQSIKIIQVKLQNQYWFDCKKAIGKYKGATITKTCVSELAWNKAGKDLIAIGTTSGYVLVYEVDNACKNILQVKGHEGNIKNILWVPQSANQFLTSSFQNEILRWDLRTTNNYVDRFEYSQNTKIRDIKFNLKSPNLVAVQCSKKIQIFDFRDMTKPLHAKEILQNQVQGNVVEWDPRNPNRVASGISKQINIFSIDGQKFQRQQTLTHYSLIKSFKWMNTKENFFGISGQHPQKHICFYDLEDKNKVAYMYGGHNRSIDYWMMNSDESLIISASNTKEKKEGNRIANSAGFIVAQYMENYIDPNEIRFNYPLTFDNNNSLAFTVKYQDQQKSESKLRKSSKVRYAYPIIYTFEQQNIFNDKVHFQNIKQEIIYLHNAYKIQGKGEETFKHNSKIARQVGKQRCAELWKHLNILAFPPASEDHTVQSIFQQKLKLDVSLSDYRIVLHNKAALKKQSLKFDINQILQDIVDENELQTAVIASICLINRDPSLISQIFFHKIFTPYIEILRNLQLYSIASETILFTKLDFFTSVTTRDTTYSITCGWCKESMTKGNCKCNLLCVLCQERLSQRMVIWCKFCGHGGHASQYRKWFKDSGKTKCPHGCDHTCFTPDDFL